MLHSVCKKALVSLFNFDDLQPKYRLTLADSSCYNSYRIGMEKEKGDFIMRKKFIAVLMISAMILTFAAPLSVSAASAPKVWSVTWARGYSSYNRVRLEWKQVSNADGYRIYWAANGVRGNVVLKGRNTLKYTHVITDRRLLDRDITYVVYAVRLGTVNGKKNQVVAMSPSPCTITAAPIRLMTIGLSTIPFPKCVKNI